MKHQDFPIGGGLPDAPMIMPTQQLERGRSMFDLLFLSFFVRQRR